MNYKRYVLLFNIFFIVLLFVASLFFEWKPGIVGPNFKPPDILSDVLKDSTGARKHIKGKVNDPKGDDPKGKFVERDYTSYPGLVNTSGQPTALSDFFNHLVALKQKKRKKIRVAYFGDSMVEGDLITQDLRRMLQEVFGGTGVGFVPVTSIVAGFRQTITHSFTPNWDDVNYKSDNKATHDLFISGHSFFSSGNSLVTYRAVDQPRLNAFEQMSVLFGSPVGGGDANADIVVNGTAHPIHANALMNKLDLPMNNAKEARISISSTTIPLYGAAFESDSGVVVDNFSFRGISGVELDYFSENYFKQVQETRPYDLMIFHYGVNLLFKPNLTEFNWYTKKMQPILQKIKNACPGTSMLMITTADKGFSYGGSWHTAKGLEPLIDAQYIMAKNTGIDFFNLYNAMGGEDAIVRWATADPSLANKDYTHANHRGAKKLAEFIFNAIMNEYKEYEKNNSK